MNIYEKINAIMESVESLQKDGKVAFGTTKYNYLSEAKTTAEMRKQLILHKLVILPIGVEERKEGQITHGLYTYKLINAEAPEEYILLQSGGQGHDSADKGSGKASSYAYKYLMWRTFAIPSNDDPDQVSSDEIKSKEEDEVEKIKHSKIDKVGLAALREKMTTKGIAEEKICEAYKVDKLADLTKEQFVSAMTRLDK